MDRNANKEILERKNHKHVPDSYSEVCKEMLERENDTYILDSYSEAQFRFAKICGNEILETRSIGALTSGLLDFQLPR